MSDVYANLAVGYVLTPPSTPTAGTSVVLQSGQGARFPTTYPFQATIQAANTLGDPTNAEIVTVTARSTDTLTIVRARESTTARTVVAGDMFYMSITKQVMTNLSQRAFINVKDAPYNAAGDGSTDDTAAIAAAVLAAAAVGINSTYLGTPAGTALYKGGADVYFPPGIYLTGPIALGNRVGIRGDGFGSIIRLKANTSGSIITNTPHCIMQRVTDIRLDGNATNQTTTTIAAASNGLALPQTTITVASTTGFPASGTILVTTTSSIAEITYTGTTSTTFTGCANVNLPNPTGWTLATGGRVTQYAHGIYFDFRTTNDPAQDEDYDLNCRIRNAFCYNVVGDGVILLGRGSSHITDLKTFLCGRNGLRQDQDVMVLGADIGWSGADGIFVQGAGGQLSNCKSYAAGKTLAGGGTWAGLNSGVHLYYLNNTTLSAISCQDNSQNGLLIEGCTGTSCVGVEADSNNAGNTGGAGIAMYSSSAIVVASATDNNRNTNRQPYGLNFGGGNTACQVMLTSNGNTTGDVTTTQSNVIGNNISINADALTATPFQTVDPTTPTTTSKLFSRFRAARYRVAKIDPTNAPAVLQPGLDDVCAVWMRAFGNGTTVIQDGLTPTAIGTATAANWASTSALASLKRISYISAATSGSSGGVKHNVLQWWRGNAAGLGGFHLVTQFGFQSIPATRRWFVGFMGSTTTPTGDPSAITTMCGVGQDSADTNVQFMINDASGTATKSVGSSTLTSPAVNEVWQVEIFAPPNGSYIGMAAGRISGTVTLSEYNSGASTDIPPNTSALLPIFYANNNTTAAVIDPCLISMYLETDM